MIEGRPIDDNALMHIENDYYEQMFDGRLCPSQNAGEGKKKKEYPFQTMWELFVYAAILGIRFDKPKEIIKPHKPFRWLNIASNHRKNLLLLVTSKANSLEFLKNGDVVKQTIEEYANGGLSLINQEIKNNPSSYNGLEDITYRMIEDIEGL